MQGGLRFTTSPACIQKNAAGVLAPLPGIRAQVPGLFVSIYIKVNYMGRGDKKTKKGKIFKGSFGKSRPAKPSKKSTPAADPKLVADPKKDTK
jgi:30S ribosomal protein S31